MSESSKFEGVPRVEISPEKRVQGIINEAFGLIQKRFVIPADPEKKLDFDPDNELAFHGVAHTEGVIRRTEAILRAMQPLGVHAVTEKDILLAKIAAAFHDVVQKWEPEDRKGALIRKRKTEVNEQASADEAIAFLKQEMETSGEKYFTEEDLEIIREAIQTTVPGLDMDKMTVIQPKMHTPKISERSRRISKALALADLGTAGMDGAAAFLQDGDTLFREENLDIARALRNQEELSDEVKEAYRKRMFDWSVGQPIFANWRRNLLDEDLEGVTPEMAASIKLLFNTFDESISASKERAEKREGMSFDELALDMGFLEKKPMNH